MTSTINLYSGLTREQYDRLLTAAHSTCYSEIVLLIRRLAHLILHCEWIKDAVLVDRLARFVQNPNNVIDANVQHIYQAFRIRLVDIYKKPPVEAQLRALQQKIDPANPLPQTVDPESLKSPFSVDLHHLAGNDNSADGKGLLDYELFCSFTNDSFMNVDLKVLLEKVETSLKEIDRMFDTNFKRLNALNLARKEEYISRLRKTLQGIHAHYDHFLENIRKNYTNRGQYKLSLNNLEPDVGKSEARSFRESYYPIQHFAELTKILFEIEVELGIYQRFKQLVDTILNSIMRHDPHWQRIHPEVKHYPVLSRESLAKELRTCRQFIIERSLHHAQRYGEDRGGASSYPFKFIVEKALNNEVFRPKSFQVDGTMVNGRLICRDNTTQQKYWVPIIEESKIISETSLTSHCWSEIYSNTNDDAHFVLLDNLSRPIQRKSLNMKYQKIREHLVVFPESYHPPLTPCPEKWIIPQWERNNCFFSNALIHLAVLQFYRMQNKNKS